MVLYSSTGFTPFGRLAGVFFATSTVRVAVLPRDGTCVWGMVAQATPLSGLVLLEQGPGKWLSFEGQKCIGFSVVQPSTQKKSSHPK